MHSTKETIGAAHPNGHANGEPHTTPTAAGPSIAAPSSGDNPGSLDVYPRLIHTSISPGARLAQA